MKQRGRARAREKKIKEPRGRDRLGVLSVVVVLMTAALIAKLFDLQILDHAFYAALAKDQHELIKDLQPERGRIFVKERGGDVLSGTGLYAVAENQELSLVYAIPKRITDPEQTAEKLKDLVGVDKEVLQERFSKSNDLYEPVAHFIDEDTKKKIDALALPGIAFLREPQRFYPEGEPTSQITGFVGNVNDERIGQYGIEQAFEELLKGQRGYISGERAAGGQLIGVGDTNIVEAQHGADVVLTLDRTVQYTACNTLKKTVEEFNAKKGTIIIMNPKTGEILAMCNAPMFDPNHYGDAEDIAVYSNDAVSDAYESGSVFKPIVMAMALNDGKVTPETVHVDTGSVTIGKYTIHNFNDRSYGAQTMTQVLENSVNTGAIEAARYVGVDRFEQYVKDFGFGEKTDIRLPNEHNGDISSLALDKEIYMATASYGQGITVTPIQLITAYAAIANGGKLMRPYIVDEVVKSEGVRVKTEPQVVRQVMSPQTAKTLTAMLVSVVKNGHAKRAAVTGYHIAGKTGTAQVPKTNGAGYDEEKHKDTFVGMFPATDPQIVMLIKIDLPSTSAAASTTTPAFHDLADFLVEYYQIPPDDVD